METTSNNTDELRSTQLPALPKAHIGHISLTTENPTAVAAFY